MPLGLSMPTATLAGVRRRMTVEGLYGRRKMTAMIRRRMPGASPGSVDRPMRKSERIEVARTEPVQKLGLVNAGAAVIAVSPREDASVFISEDHALTAPIRGAAERNQLAHRPWAQLRRGRCLPITWWTSRANRFGWQSVRTRASAASRTDPQRSGAWSNRRTEAANSAG